MRRFSPKSLLALIVATCCSTAFLRAAEPDLKAIFPMGCPRGESVEVTLLGSGLDEAVRDERSRGQYVRGLPAWRPDGGRGLRSGGDRHSDRVFSRPGQVHEPKLVVEGKELSHLQLLPPLMVGTNGKPPNVSTRALSI